MISALLVTAETHARADVTADIRADMLLIVLAGSAGRVVRRTNEVAQR